MDRYSLILSDLTYTGDMSFRSTNGKRVLISGLTIITGLDLNQIDSCQALQ